MSDDKVTVYGPALSSYVRTALMTCMEKGVEVELEAVDRDSPAYGERHPWRKVPAFEHNGFRLYETAAICRYVDEAFDGPALQPETPERRARMTQCIGISDSYLYRPAVIRILLPIFLWPRLGREVDEADIEAAVPEAAKALAVLDGLLGQAPFLAGGALSLADLHVYPVVSGLGMVPQQDRLFADAERLRAWSGRMSERPSAVATAPQL